MLFVLFAQDGTGGIVPGASGWVGAGLLGAVLGWLLFLHLPAKDKLIIDLVKTFAVESEAQRVAYKEESKQQREACEQHLDKILQQLARGQK